MSSPKVNPALIGLFTLVALAGIFVTALFLGAGKFNQRSTDYVLFFDQDISGLDVGAPVTFRGVRVGEVTGIRIVYDAAAAAFQIPIVVNIREDLIDVENVGARPDIQDLHQFHVNQGLRAQLDSQSLVTGKLKISLDYHPRAPLVYNERYEGPLQQIPTIPTLLVSLGKKFESLSLDKTLGQLGESAGHITNWLSSGRLEGIAENVRLTLASSRRVMDEEIPALRQELRGVMTEIEKTAVSTRNLMDYLERHPDALLKGKQP